MILAVLLLYIYPISESFERQDDVSYVVAFRTVTNFVDSVRNKGYITPTMYNEFHEQLHATGNTYDVQMEHYHKKYDPVYQDNLFDPTQPSTFQGDFQVNDDGFYNEQIFKVLFPDNADPKDSKTRRYRMSVGDLFKVTVVNTNRTNATVLRDILNNGNSPTEKIVIPYGGMVQNEDY